MYGAHATYITMFMEDYSVCFASGDKLMSEVHIPWRGVGHDVLIVVIVCVCVRVSVCTYV